MRSLFEGTDPERVEVSDNLIEKYIVNGTEYYIYDNNGWASAVWIRDNYECYISGDITMEDIKRMVDSIWKG